MNKIFIPGLELNYHYYNDVIKPLLKKKFPTLLYSSALLGYGSDVLGCDTKISTDHNWGPRCIIFLDKENIDLKNEINSYLSNSLPFKCKGYPTNFTSPRYDSTQSMQVTEKYPINHLIEIYEIDGYFQYNLQLKDINQIAVKDWINFNEQKLLELTSGDVFHDGLKKLNTIRAHLSFYPADILKLRLASLWLSIWNEEPFIGRCIDVNDFIGLKLISTRIVNILMKISFYLERKYIPYSKWFGTFFNSLHSADTLKPMIYDLLTENASQKIEKKLCNLYLRIVDLHNKVEDLPKINNQIQNFFNRPYKVIFSENIVDVLVESIEDEDIKKSDLRKIAIDIKLDSVDFT